MDAEVIESQWFQKVLEQFDDFCDRLDEKIDKKRQRVKASKKKTETEIKLAQEIKLHNELTERLSELSRRGGELDRVCATLESLTIAESDKNRLENAKESYEIAKELTGIRFDFKECKALTVAKGYIKSESRKLLQPFELSAGDSEALWSLIHSTAAPGWPDKENHYLIINSE